MNTVPIPEAKQAAKAAESTTQARKAARAKKLAGQLALFNCQPDSGRVGIDVVCALFGRSPESIWRDLKAGRIPEPVKAGPRCTRWKVGDLRGALQ